jgi:hypothetical protein
MEIYEEERRDLFSQANHTNVLVVSAPHRYDKPQANVNIDEYNKKLSEAIEDFKGTLPFPQRLQFLDINTELEETDFGRMGIHLNKKGKMKLSESIANSLNNFQVGDDAPAYQDPKDF